MGNIKTVLKEKALGLIKRCKAFFKDHIKICTSVICIVIFCLIFCGYALTQEESKKDINSVSSKQVVSEEEKDVKASEKKDKKSEKEKADKEDKEKPKSEEEKKEVVKKEETKPNHTISTNTNTNKPPANENAGANNTVQIPSRYVYANNRSTIHQPTQSVFGEYYSYAMEMYNYAKTGRKTGSFVFKTNEDVLSFEDKLARTVFQDSNTQYLKKAYRFSTVSKADGTIEITYNNVGHTEYIERVNAENLIVSLCGNSATDKGVIDTLNRWLINNTVYDSNLASVSYTYTGVVKNRRATCSGFTEFIELACEIYGIPNSTKLNSKGNHIWNRVQIGGVWYYIDTTWNVCDKANNYYLSKTLWSDHY